MAESDFGIKINVAADLSGFEKTKAGFAEMDSQIKKLEADIQSAQRMGVTVPQGELEKLGKLKSAVESYGKTIKEEGVSHKEMHEGLKLIGITAGDALGPIGELAHFLGNPYLAAAFGAIAAIKMLVDQHQHLREEMEKNVRTTRELHEAYANNYDHAVRHVTESVAEYRHQLAQAGQEQNEFASRLGETTALIHQQAAAIASLAQAYRQLYDANIQGAVISGQMTGPEGHSAEEHARQQARAQEEQAEHEAHAREVASQREAATNANAEAGLLSDQATSQNRTAERARLLALVQDAQDEVGRRKPKAKDTGDEADTAKAAAALLGVRPTAAQAAAVPGMLDAARASHAAGATGIVAVEAEALDIQKRLEAWKKYDEASKAHTIAIDEVHRAEGKLSQAQIQQRDYESETERLQSRAEQLRAFAEDTNRAADAQERLNRASDAAHGPIDQVQDETQRQLRRNYLNQRGRSGQLTPDEALEAAGASASNPGHVGGDLATRLGELSRHVEIFEGGHANAAETQELRAMMDTLIGLMENQFARPSQHQVFQGFESRICRLESNAQDHQRQTTDMLTRMNSSPYCW